MQQTPVKTRQFLNPEALLKSIPLEPEMIVVDLGCGNGHYAAAAGMMVGKKGQVHAFDVLEDSLSQTATLARLVGVQNVATRQCDLEKLGSCDLEGSTADVAIVSSILHQLQNKENIIREAYRLLKTGGRLVAVEWKQDSPFGPPVSERVNIEDMRGLLERYGLRPVSELPAGSFHYALLYIK